MTEHCDRCKRPLASGVAGAFGLCRQHLAETYMRVSYEDFALLVLRERTAAGEMT